MIHEIWVLISSVMWALPWVNAAAAPPWYGGTLQQYFKSQKSVQVTGEHNGFPIPLP